MKVSCVIPAHNEEENLKRVMDRLLPTLESYDETKD